MHKRVALQAHFVPLDLVFRTLSRRVLLLRLHLLVLRHPIVFRVRQGRHVRERALEHLVERHVVQRAPGRVVLLAHARAQLLQEPREARVAFNDKRRGGAGRVRRARGAQGRPREPLPLAAERVDGGGGVAARVDEDLRAVGGAERVPGVQEDDVEEDPVEGLEVVVRVVVEAAVAGDEGLDRAEEERALGGRTDARELEEQEKEKRVGVLCAP